LPVLKEKKAHSLEGTPTQLIVTTPVPTQALRKGSKSTGEPTDEISMRKARSTGEVVSSDTKVHESQENTKKAVVEEVKSSDSSAVTTKTEVTIAAAPVTATTARRKATEEVHQEEENEKKRFKQILAERKEQIKASIKGDEIYPLVVVQEVFSCSAIDIFNTVFSDRKITFRGKSYDCFWALAKAEACDTDVKHTKWSPSAPYEGIIDDKTSLECLKKIAEGTKTSTKGFVYTHPVTGGGPFVPKQCQVEEKQTGHWLSPEEFVMQMEVFTSKVPMSDTFVVKNCFKIRELPGKKCEWTWRLGVEFVKSTIFRGKIEKTSQEENGNYANKMFMPAMREHLATYLKEKAALIKKREAKREAEREVIQRLKAEAAASATIVVQPAENKVENPAVVEPVKEEKSPIEEVKKEAESPKDVDMIDESGQEDESEKQDKVGIRESLESEIVKVLKATEQSKEEMKSEIKGLKMLILALLAMNGLMFFFMFLKK